MILSKRHLAIFAILALLVCISLAGVMTRGEAVAASRTARELPIYCVESEEKQIALTFDAAWGAEDTPVLIRILAEHNVPATFFLVGQWVDQYPECVKALHDAGHSVMNHSNTHPHLPELSPQNALLEVDTASDKIEAITGVRPELIRPPYGDYNDSVVRTLKGAGYAVIQWSVDSLDWKGISASEIQKRVLSRAEPGAIVLFHNAAEHTPEALPGIIEALTLEGYTFVTVNDLILRKNYYMDHTGKQMRERTQEAS